MSSQVSGVSSSGIPAPVPDRARLERAKVATAVVFAGNGMAFASWAGRLPAVRERLDLTPGQLGILMLVGSVGSLFGLPVAGRIATRLGAAGTVLLGTLLMLAGLGSVGLVMQTTGSPVMVGAVLFLMCFGMGLWDVSMNLHGADVEQRLGRTIMPRFHAAFSLGTVGAALAAAGAARAGIPVSVHLAVAALVLAAGTIVALRSFVPTLVHPEPEATPDQVGPHRDRSAWTEPRTLLIGLVVFVAAFTEGSANDWLSIAFVDGHHLPEWLGILGLATFLAFMTVGRLAGTHLLDRYGRVPVVRVTQVMAGIGSLLLIFGSAPLAFVGAAIWGVGASLGFPVGISAAADNPRRAAARVSVVSSIGYIAFLAGPPLLGLLGDHVGVLRALTLVSALIVVAVLASPVLTERKD